MSSTEAVVTEPAAKKSVLEYLVEREHALTQKLNNEKFKTFLKAKVKAFSSLSEDSEIYLKSSDFNGNIFKFVVRRNGEHSEITIDVRKI